MEKKEYKEFYKYLLEIDVIPEPFDEESFDEYLFDNYKSKVLNLDFVSNRRELLNDFSDKFNKQNELFDKPYIDTEDIENYLKGVL